MSNIFSGDAKKLAFNASFLSYSIFGLGHVLNGKSSGTVYHLIFERHFITLVCQLIGLEA